MQEQREAVAYLCDRQGMALKKLRDELGCPSLAAGVALESLALNGSRAQFAAMFHSVREQGAVFDWELTIPVQGEPEALHFAAASGADSKVLVISGRSRYEIVRLFDDLASEDAVLQRALRTAIRDEAARRRESADQASEFFSEISRLSQELALSHRELAHKTTLLEEGSHALQESEGQVRAIFANAMESMVVLDEEGRFVRANPATARMFGTPLEQLHGKTIAEFVELGPVATRIGNVFRKAESRQGEFALRSADGRSVQVEYSATADFMPGRHLMILRDVTGRKQQEAEIRQLNESLERRVV